MRRREFIKLLSGAATAWPLAAHAEQPAIPVIGFLDSRYPGAVENRLRGLHQGLKEAGYIEGENLANAIPVGRRSTGQGVTNRVIDRQQLLTGKGHRSDAAL